MHFGQMGIHCSESLFYASGCCGWSCLCRRQRNWCACDEEICWGSMGLLGGLCLICLYTCVGALDVALVFSFCEFS